MCIFRAPYFFWDPDAIVGLLLGSLVSYLTLLVCVYVLLTFPKNIIRLDPAFMPAWEPNYISSS